MVPAGGNLGRRAQRFAPIEATIKAISYAAQETIDTREHAGALLPAKHEWTCSSIRLMQMSMNDRKSHLSSIRTKMTESARR